MSAGRPDSENSLEALRARSVRGREAVLARVARVRLAIVCAVAAMTCTLAVLIASSSSARSTPKAASGAGVPGSVRPLLGNSSPDGGGDGFAHAGSSASPPSVGSGGGDVTSGGS